MRSCTIAFLTFNFVCGIIATILAFFGGAGLLSFGIVALAIDVGLETAEAIEILVAGVLLLFSIIFIVIGFTLSRRAIFLMHNNIRSVVLGIFIAIFGIIPVGGILYTIYSFQGESIN